MEKAPNFMVVGAAKAGTTSLYHYLQQHPDVFMPVEKEPHHFSQVRPDPAKRAFYKHIPDRATYLALFSGVRAERAIGEASTSYLWDEETPRRIREFNPATRIIIMLREPVQRAYSHYLNDVREGYEKRPFLTAIEEDLRAERKGWGVSSLYVDLGRYCEQVRRYLEFFPGQVLVLFFEEFIRDPRAALRQTFSFLGVDPEFAEQVELEIHNPYAEPTSLGRVLLGSGMARTAARILVPRGVRAAARDRMLKVKPKPSMDTRAGELLSRVYAGEAECLAELLGRPVPWSTTAPAAPS